METESPNIDESKLRRLIGKHVAARAHLSHVSAQLMEVRNEIIRQRQEEKRRTRRTGDDATTPEIANLETERKQLAQQRDVSERELQSLDYVLRAVDYATSQGYRVDIDAGSVFRPASGSLARVAKPLGAQ